MNLKVFRSPSGNLQFPQNRNENLFPKRKIIFHFKETFELEHDVERTFLIQLFVISKAPQDIPLPPDFPGTHCKDSHSSWFLLCAPGTVIYVCVKFAIKFLFQINCLIKLKKLRFGPHWTKCFSKVALVASRQHDPSALIHFSCDLVYPFCMCLSLVSGEKKVQNRTFFFHFLQEQNQNASESQQNEILTWDNWDTCHGYDAVRCARLLEEVNALREVLRRQNITLIVSTLLHLQNCFRYI